MKKSSKDLFDKRHRFSIRRLSVGVASIVVGCVLVGSGNHLVLAEMSETDAPTLVTEETGTSLPSDQLPSLDEGEGETDQVSPATEERVNPEEVSQPATPPVAEVPEIGPAGSTEATATRDTGSGEGLATPSENAGVGEPLSPTATEDVNSEEESSAVQLEELETAISSVRQLMVNYEGEELVEIEAMLQQAEEARETNDPALMSQAYLLLRELLELRQEGGEEEPRQTGDAGQTGEAQPLEQPTTSSPVAANQTLSIENAHIKQEFTIENGVLRTRYLENKLNGNERLEFAADSKEFLIQFAAPTLPEYLELSSDRASWQVETNSHANAATATEEGPARLAFDGKLSSIWHTNYAGSGGQGQTGQFPYTIDMTFPESKEIKTFVYVPRVVGVNGDIRGYRLLYKTDTDTEFQVAKVGELASLGMPKEPQLIELDQAIQAKTLRLEVTSSQNGQAFAAAAELDVTNRTATEVREYWAGLRAQHTALLEEHAATASISTDRLRVAENGITQTREDGVQKTVFTFNTFQYQGTEYQVRYVVELHEDAKFLVKYLELKVVGGQAEGHPIASIDLQSYKLQGNEKVWKLPDQANIAEMAGFNGFYAGLGQPVYIKSFYTGSNFPIAWNTIDNENVVYSRYYSGKSLSQLPRTEDGFVQTWNTVFGVARSDDYQVLQQDFYKYIEAIGQKTYYRTQYNSWFDHMLNINAQNIQDSFNEIERGFTNGGVAPLHSYVVDDGWQDMRTLWDFNSKFPNKLYDSSKQAQRFGSNFGLWVGPQGGYSQPGYLADNLVNQGLASKHAGVVYIGDNRYVEGMRDVFTGYEEEFDINYWKLDGLLLKPRADTDSANYIGGGYMNMYSMTEAHERWISLYESIREHAKDPDQMWINLTSYIPPSPWYLQWVNSIWMQNAADVDFQDNKKAGQYASLDFGGDADEAITYRDDRYEEVVNLRKWQLPFANIYNHDPVYGNTANSGKSDRPGGPQRPRIEFSTDELRTYLYMLGTRGTGFWEFYYSYNMMDDEKWQVNGEAVNWIGDNFETLRNARFHGGKPGHGEVYGYSAWDADKGILSIRNPINSQQTYRVTLDRLVGVLEGTGNMHRKIVLGDSRHNSTELMNYGDEFEITLNGYETVIFEFNKEADVQPASVYKAKVETANTIRVQFDERVFIDQASFQVNGESATAQLQADYRTVVLTLPRPLTDRQEVTVTYANVTDAAATPNVATGQVSLRAYDQGKILDISQVELGSPLVQEGFSGRGEFSVTVKANLARLDQILASQEGNWSLRVDQDGRAIFDVKGLEVRSAPFVDLRTADRGTPDELIQPGQDVTITASRHTNGALRIYINGVLHATTYEKDRVNEVLDYATVTVGNPDFEGTISRLLLETGARDFETAVTLYDQLNPRDYDRDLREAIDTITSTSYDPNDSGERPASAATDGSLATYWASNPSNSNVANRQYLTLTFDGVQTVDKVTYFSRQHRNAVGNAKKAYLEYTVDGQEWHRLPLTNGNADHTKNLDSAVLEGQELTFAPTEMTALRFYAPETHHWSDSLLNTVVAVAELVPSVLTHPVIETPLDFTYLRNSLANAEAKQASDYTEESYGPLAEFLQLKDSLLLLETQEAINEANQELRALITNLELRPSTQPADQPGESGDQPGTQPDNQSGESGDPTGSQPDDQSGEPGDQPDSQPDNQAGESGDPTGSQPDNQAGESGNQTGSQPDNQAGEPGDQTGSQPDDQPGESGDQPGSQPDNQSGDTGDQTGSQPADQPGDTGDQTGTQPADQPGEPGDQPGSQPDNQSGDPGDQTGNQPDNQSGESGDQPGSQPDNQSGESGDQTGSQPADQPGEPGDQPGSQPADQPGESDNQTDSQPDNQSGEPDDQSGNQPADQPGESGDQPGSQPVDQPGDTGDQTGSQPSDQPGESGDQPGSQPDNQSGESGDQTGSQPDNQSGESGNQTGSQPDNQSGESGDQPGSQPADQPGESGDQTGSQPDNQSGEPGDQPGNQPDNQSGETGDQPGSQPDNQSGESGDQTDSQPDNQSGESGDQPGSQPADQPGESGDQTGSQPDNQSGETGDQSGSQPDNQSGESGDQPGSQPDNQSGESGDQTGNQPADQPGDTGDQTGSQPTDQSGEGGDQPGSQPTDPSVEGDDQTGSQPTDQPGEGGDQTGSQPTDQSEGATTELAPEPFELKESATGVRVLFEAGENQQIVSLQVTHKETNNTNTPTILAEEDYDLFDIVLLDSEGQPVQNTKDTLVILPVDEGKEVARVIYLPNSNQEEVLDFTETVAYDEQNKPFKAVVFVAKHFSEYGIVYRLITGHGTGVTAPTLPAFDGEIHLVPSTAPQAEALPELDVSSLSETFTAKGESVTTPALPAFDGEIHLLPPTAPQAEALPELDVSSLSETFTAKGESVTAPALPSFDGELHWIPTNAPVAAALPELDVEGLPYLLTAKGSSVTAEALPRLEAANLVTPTSSPAKASSKDLPNTGLSTGSWMVGLGIAGLLGASKLRRKKD